MELNSLEKLAQNVEKGEKVTDKDIHLAYKKAKREIQKEYQSLKGTPETIAGYRERLRILRDKMLQDIREPEGIYEKARSGVVSGTKTLLDSADAIFGDTHESFRTYREFIHGKTNPDGDDPIAEDFEGWGGIGKSGMKDGNFNNDARWLLSGYLLGLQIDDRDVASKAMEKAHKIYENSAGFFGDKVLTVDHLMNDLGMEAYVQDVLEFGLAKEPTGLLAGYLKLANNLEPQKRKMYREYLFKKMEGLVKAKKFDYEPKEEEPEIMQDYNRGDFQLSVLEKELLSPRQFYKETPADEAVREQKISDTVDKAAAIGVATVINPVNGLMAAYNAVFGDEEKGEKSSSKKKENPPKK